MVFARDGAALDEVRVPLANRLPGANTLQREQFGRPLAGFQILQDRLVKMLAEVTAMQLYCMQLARLDQAGWMSDTIAGLAKFHNTRKARWVKALIVRRDITGIGAFR